MSDADGDSEQDAWDTYIQGTNLENVNQAMIFDPAFTDGGLGAPQGQAGQSDGKQQTPMPQLQHLMAPSNTNSSNNLFTGSPSQA